MKSVNVESLQKDFFNILNEIVKNNKPAKIKTENGNVIIMSENEYNGLMATLEIYANPKLKKKIIEGAKTPVKDCIDIDNSSILIKQP